MQAEIINERPPERRAKIMVVDDDPDLRQALSLRLRANNFDTVNVCDGYSAIAMAQKEHPHLIILDLGLPAGDGFAVQTPAGVSRACIDSSDCADGARSRSQ